MEVKEKLAKLREKMAEAGIDFYLMPGFRHFKTN